MSSLDELRAELERLRDEAKVKAHLGSMEAREEWDKLEQKWENFSARAGLKESEANIRATLDILADELKAAYRKLTKAV